MTGSSTLWCFLTAGKPIEFTTLNIDVQYLHTESIHLLHCEMLCSSDTEENPYAALIPSDLEK